MPVLLAGGLTPEDLPRVLALLRDAAARAPPAEGDAPFADVWGVDVASGVEYAPGAAPQGAHPCAKDPERVSRFIAAASAAVK